MHERVHITIPQLCEHRLEAKMLHVYFYVVIETKKTNLIV